ncbi:MAG: DUF6261 family protein [Bacteroidales bacterium]|jgi:hypothetical protein|nr:DUF6261 family protein [Bacteroidales bacterium]
MSLKIDGYKSLLTRIAIAQNVQFHKEAATGIAPFAVRINGIATASNTYQEDTDRLDDEFNTQTKSIETTELDILDDKRDGTTVQIINRIDYHAKFPENNEEADAAHKLKFITDTYRDAPRKNYQAETSYLRNMVEDLNQHADSLALFGLTSLVNKLERENNDFEVLYITRTGKKETKRGRGTLTELAGKANTSFDIVCQIINGLLLMPLDTNTKVALDEVIDFINGQIHQYTVVYRRHAGIAVKKKTGRKDNGS